MIEVKKEIISTADADECWRRVLETSSLATFFHCKDWTDILTAVFQQWQTELFVVRFNDGNFAVMPLMKSKGIIPFYEGMLTGVYGGPLFFLKPEPEHLAAFWREVIRSFSNIIIYGNPFLEKQDLEMETQTVSTHLLDLSAGIDAIWSGINKGHKGNIRTAEKKGVRVSQAETDQDFEDYYEMYQNSLKRWGKRAGGFYPRKLFLEFEKHKGYGRSIKLLLAKADGKVLAGAWLLFHKQHAVYWHGAAYSEKFNFHPAHYLIFNAIKQCCQENYRWFDFNPSGGNKGVEFFKEGFGAKRMEFLRYRRLNLLGKGHRAGRFFYERIFRKCSL